MVDSLILHLLTAFNICLLQVKMRVAWLSYLLLTIYLETTVGSLQGSVYKNKIFLFLHQIILDLDDKYPVLNYEDENDLLGEFTQIKKLLRFSFQKGKMEELYEDYGELKLEEWLRIKLRNV